MTTRERILAVTFVVALVAIGGAAIAVADKNSETKVCPDGQSLKWAKVHDGEGGLNAATLPPELAEQGYTAETGVGGSGAQYRVTTSEDTARVDVKRGPISLEIGCA